MAALDGARELINTLMNWVELLFVIIYRIIGRIDRQQTLYLMIFSELWLILHYAGKLKQWQLQLKVLLAAAKTDMYSASQVAILEQAMLFDREVRKVQQEVATLRRLISDIRCDSRDWPQPECQFSEDSQDVMDIFLAAHSKGLRRVCIAGRGWVNVKKLQAELGVTNQEIKFLYNA